MIPLGRGFEELQRTHEERNRETAFWTTPGLRPLSEPPALPWSTVLRQQYSEAGLSALFADDPEKAFTAKDLWGEILALSEYGEWIRMMRRDTSGADYSGSPITSEA